ncbi:MAG TPA: ABC transporter substrate-binding protein [Clostridia bacterium]|nr:ABC transporter substrate-binding protein [Clostridia bacterium]
MYKKLICLVLALVFMFTFTGCANNAATTAAPTEEIKMGFYAPLTGPTSLIGIPLQEGARLAVDEINEQGGINGKKIKLVEYDDKASAETAVKVVTRLIQEDKVNVILGSLVSGNILATANLVEKAGIPEVGTGTSPKWTAQGYKYIFRGNAHSGWYNGALIEAMKKMGVKKLALLSSSTEYAKGGSDNLLKALKEDGTIEVILHENFQGGDTDFTGQMTKMISSGADAMFLYASAEDMGMQMKQFRQLGWKGFVFGPEGFNTPDIVKVAGESADGAVFSCGYVIPESPEGAMNAAEKSFLEAYVKKYARMPVNDTAYRAYDAAKILAMGLKNANSLDGTAIRDAIKSINTYEGIAGKFDFTAGTGDGVSTARAYIIQGGKNVPLEKYLETKK